MVDETPTPTQVHIACEAEGCTENANARPLVVLRRPSPFPPLEVMLDLWVCDVHKAETTLDNLFSEDSWRRLGMHFAIAGQPRPIRELSELKWTQLT